MNLFAYSRTSEQNKMFLSLGNKSSLRKIQSPVHQIRYKVQSGTKCDKMNFSSEFFSLCPTVTIQKQLFWAHFDSSCHANKVCIKQAFVLPFVPAVKQNVSQLQSDWFEINSRHSSCYLAYGNLPYSLFQYLDGIVIKSLIFKREGVIA